MDQLQFAEPVNSSIVWRTCPSLGAALPLLSALPINLSTSTHLHNIGAAHRMPPPNVDTSVLSHLSLIHRVGCTATTDVLPRSMQHLTIVECHTTKYRLSADSF